MLTGDVLILFVSAAGIGAATSVSVYDRRLRARLATLRQDVDHLRSALQDQAAMLTKVERAIVRLRRQTDSLEESRPVGKTPYDRTESRPTAYADMAARAYRHPMYAKTGLPNQPVAYLLPEPATPQCLVCGHVGPRAEGTACANCGD